MTTRPTPLSSWRRPRPPRRALPSDTSYPGAVTGSIYLGGGGDATAEEALWRAMLPTKRRVLYWPFALSDDMLHGAEEWLSTSLAGLGLDVELETWFDLRGHHPEELAHADLLFVGGGNTFKLLQCLRDAGFAEAITRFVGHGGDYYGGSAGAVLACADISVAVGVDENEAGLTDLTGLGLTSGFAVLPHYEDHQRPVARRWSTDHAQVLLGIPERSGLVCRDGFVQVEGHAAVVQFNGDAVTVHQPGDRWNASQG